MAEHPNHNPNMLMTLGMTTTVVIIVGFTMMMILTVKMKSNRGRNEE